MAVNRKLDKAAAEAIAEIFTEVVIAPDADEDAIAVFAKKKNLRLLIAGGLPDPATPGLSVKTVAGGFLTQSRDNGRIGARRSQGRHQETADATRKSATWCSRSASPST